MTAMDHGSRWRLLRDSIPASFLRGRLWTVTNSPLCRSTRIPTNKTHNLLTSIFSTPSSTTKPSFIPETFERILDTPHTHADLGDQCLPCWIEKYSRIRQYQIPSLLMFGYRFLQGFLQCVCWILGNSKIRWDLGIWCSWNV